MMNCLIYDGTYHGWLTAVFDVFDYKFKDVSFFKSETLNLHMFSVTRHVITDEEKANRVIRGLEKRLSTEGLKRLYKTFLSEEEKSEELMLRFVSHVFTSKMNVEQDFSNADVWEIKQTSKRVKRDAHRMKAFVRFQLTKDQLFYSIVEPDHNVLPLISSHFKGRYADQRWLIYDARRKYGIYYDLEKVSTIQIEFNQGTASSKFIEEISDEREAFFQELWRRYFSSVNIAARKNTRLHVQEMPKRYWKHMTEKMYDL